MINTIQDGPDSTVRVEITLDLQPAMDVLNDYYGMKLPKDTMAAIITNSGTVFGEMLDNSIRDTAAREYLIDAVTKYFDMTKHWPCNGDSDEYSVAFFTELTKKVAEANGECAWEDK